MNAKAYVVGLAVLLLAGSLGLGLAPPTAAADLSGAQGGDLRVALQGFGGPDPRTASAADRKVLELVYDSLGRIDPVSLQMVPWAATGWVWDGKQNITVSLRSDLRFHDGAAFDANDVATSLRQYMRGGESRWTIFVENSRTLRFDFANISLATYNHRTTNKAGPGHFFTEGLSAMIAWDASGTQKYSGPFAVRSFDATAGTLVLGPNGNHFTGRPNLDSITYRWLRGGAPFTLERNPNGSSKINDAGCALMFRDVHLIGWTVLSNDLFDPRDCVASHGGFPDGTNKSLVNPDPTKSVPFVLATKNQGTDLLLFGFAQNAGSLFVGNPGTSAEKLRNAIYLLVNKFLYAETIEGNAQLTHGLVNRANSPWAVTNCPPFTPCDVSVTADDRPLPAPALRGTDTDPAAIAMDKASFLDRNGDGIRETTTGAPIAFRLLAPSFTLDPRKTTIANDMVFLLRSIGVDAVVEGHNTFAALDAAAAACTGSCMYMKRFSGATQLPDWYYGMPELLAASDPPMNLHLNLGAATSYSHATRALHVGHVSHFATVAADLLPVLHYNAIEAVDFESFTGWVNTFGGINNFRSFVNLRLPALGSLSAKIAIIPTKSLGPGGTTTVQVEVRDAVGQAVAGAAVAFAATSGSLTPASGATDGTGIFRATYTAPATVSTGTDATITAEVTKVQYRGAVVWGTLAIHAAAASELVVSVSRGAAAEINSTATATITVEVRAGANPVANANVVLRTDLPGASITPASGRTGANGQLTATFKATVKQGMTYTITASVSAAGYQDASGRASLSVKADLGEVPVVPVQRNVPGFEAVSAIGAVAVTFLVLALARRRRED